VLGFLQPITFGSREVYTFVSSEVYEEQAARFLVCVLQIQSASALAVNVIVMFIVRLRIYLSDDAYAEEGV